MLHIRESRKVRRLCLTFSSAEEACSCYSQLARHVSVKHRTASPSSIDFYKSIAAEDEQVAQWLSEITRGSRALNAEAAEAAWHTNWPTERLVELVKLCLTDSNFPGFVAQVQQCLKMLTTIRQDDGKERFLVNEEEE